MKALFIGRFQPFHNGHLQLIQKVSKEYDEIIIGIGSSQYNNTQNNPFTSEERKKMIEESLKKNNIKNYKIELVPDLHNNPKWAPYVTSIIPDFDVVLSNNDLTKRLFKEQGYIVRETPEYDRTKYSGNQIRKKMINNEPWENLVPEPVAKIIKKIKGLERIQKLTNNKK